jgi:hypothetical protein
MNSAIFRASAREIDPRSIRWPECVKLTSHQPARYAPAQLHAQRTCLICGKRRSRGAPKTTALDQHICSRRGCAPIKAQLAGACGSGILTLQVHHYHHSSVARDRARPCVDVSELHGNASLAGRAELPVDSGCGVSFENQNHNKPATIPEELPCLNKLTKPWRTL